MAKVMKPKQYFWLSRCIFLPVAWGNFTHPRWVKTYVGTEFVVLWDERRQYRQ